MAKTAQAYIIISVSFIMFISGCMAANKQPTSEALTEQPLLVMTGAEEREIVDRVTAFIDQCWIKNDETAVPNYMAEDAIFILFYSNLYLSRSEYINHRKKLRESREQENFNVILDRIEVRLPLITGTVAKVEVRYIIIYPGGASMPAKRFLILDRQNGIWMIKKLSDQEVHFSTS